MKEVWLSFLVWHLLTPIYTPLSIPYYLHTYLLHLHPYFIKEIRRAIFWYSCPKALAMLLVIRWAWAPCWAWASWAWASSTWFPSPGIPKQHTMFFRTKCCTLWAVICATSSTSTHLVKYSMPLWDTSSDVLPKGKDLGCLFPWYGKATSNKLTATPRLVRDANQHASNTTRIIYKLYAILLHRWPIIPSTNDLKRKSSSTYVTATNASAKLPMIWVHWSPLTKVRIGWV